MSKCGKNCYDSRKLAKQAMKRINKQIKNGSRKIKNTYYCTVCSAYHLTSMTQERYNAMVKDFISCSLCSEQHNPDLRYCPNCGTKNPINEIIIQ